MDIEYVDDPNAKQKPYRNVTRRNIIEFTYTEQAREDEDENTEVMDPPKEPRDATWKTASKSIVNIELREKTLGYGTR
jgi:hypothetical protein